MEMDGVERPEAARRRRDLGTLCRLISCSANLVCLIGVLAVGVVRGVVQGGSIQDLHSRPSDVEEEGWAIRARGLKEQRKQALAQRAALWLGSTCRQSACAALAQSVTCIRFLAAVIPGLERPLISRAADNWAISPSEYLGVIVAGALSERGQRRATGRGLLALGNPPR